MIASSTTTNAAEPRPSRELVPPDSPLAPFVSIDPGRLHGEPCFKGARVPIQALFDLLRDGGDVEQFVDAFPPVGREHATAVLQLAANGLLEGLRRL